MSFLTDLYHRSLAENEKNIRFWEDYLTNLKALDFSAYTEKLRVPVMVPIGSRILFRGELKHTNEITVALGADYFVKCSVKQAEVLRQHRIKDAEEKLEMFRKGREYIEKQVSFKNENIFENQGQEIIEVHSEEEDKAWREKHRENVKQWKQKKSDDDKPQDTITDEELWNRLEELELQEELENELVKDEKQPEINIVKPFVVKEEETFRDKNRKHLAKDNNEIMKAVEQESNSEQTNIPKQEKEIKSTEAEVPKVAGKIELLQKVIEKQSELEEKLLELRNKETAKSKTEQDLIAKLDQMEALEELEDEMDRLEDIIDEENVTSEEELEEKPAESIPQTDPKKRVSFADEDDSETLQLTFYHSDVEPCKEPYDPTKGITKPSDVYEAFSSNFTETTSILKKTKYEDNKSTDEHVPKVEKKPKKKVELLQNIEEDEQEEEEEDVETRTIVVKDVVEKADVSENKSDSSDKRPMSLFKQRRQQKK